MLTIALLLGWAALLLAGTTPAGQSMRTMLIERPAAWLNRFSRGQAIFAASLMLVAALIFWIMGEAGLRVASMFAPELIGLLASIEFTAAIDAIAVAIATAASVRLRDVCPGRCIFTHATTPRSRRARRTKRPSPPANDTDRPAPALLLARAA